MPDGFDPHKELQRISTLHDLMVACRARADKIMDLADEMLDDPELMPETRLKVMEFVINRGYGKPRQSVVILDPDYREPVRKDNPVKVYIPDNKRQAMPNGPIIDAQEDGDAG